MHVILRDEQKHEVACGNIGNFAKLPQVLTWRGRTFVFLMMEFMPGKGDAAGYVEADPYPVAFEAEPEYEINLGQRV